MRLVIPGKDQSEVVISGRKNLAIRYRVRFCNVVLLLIAFISLQGCFSRGVQQQPSATVDSSGGGYYGGDRPPSSVPENLDDIPDAVVTAEPRSRTGNNPYEALGKKYYPMQEAAGFTQVGMASWYGKKFHGRRTSSGEPYDMFAMTAAHPVLPLPSYVEVENLSNGKKVVVKVNDRGPFLHNRIIDLSYAAAHQLRIVQQGTGRVRIRVLTPGNTQTIASTNVLNDRYQIQVGAYNEWQNASNVRELLRLAGYPLIPVEEGELLSSGLPYRVLVGPIPDINAANQWQQKLKGMLGHDVSIMSLRLP